MPNKHAMLSASSSARWLACPSSAQLCAALPDTVTDYALEGTCAHELAEYKVQKLLGNPASNPYGELRLLRCRNGRPHGQLRPVHRRTAGNPARTHGLSGTAIGFQPTRSQRFWYGRLRDCCRLGSNCHRLQVWQGRGGIRRPQLADDAVCSWGVGTIRCPL